MRNLIGQKFDKLTMLKIDETKPRGSGREI